MYERRRPRHSGHDEPAEPLTLTPFLSLAREISALFVPVQMRPEFRKSLEGSLLLASRQPAFAESGMGFGVGGDESRFDRRWVVGAAVGSAVSIASIVAIVWRYRGKAA